MVSLTVRHKFYLKNASRQVINLLSRYQQGTPMQHSISYMKRQDKESDHSKIILQISVDIQNPLANVQSRLLKQKQGNFQEISQY